MGRKFSSVVACLVLVLLLSFRLVNPTGSSHTSSSPKLTSGENYSIVVGLKPASAEERQRSLRALAGFGKVQVLAAQLSAAVVHVRGADASSAERKLRTVAGVAFVEPVRVMQACATPNDPSYGSLQYAPQRIQADLSWDVWLPIAPVVVAVVDTGVETTHPDLSDVIYRNASGAPIAFNAITGSSNAEDDSGHGTHSAGIIAARINNSTGIAGLAGWNPLVQNASSYVKIMPVKALDAAGNGTDANLANGIVWAADHGAKVICISSSTAASSTVLSDAVQYAFGLGCVVVAGVGNDATTALQYPAGYANVLSVAATDETDTLVDFSNYGSWVRIAAPGSNVFSTYIQGTYTPLSGTSTAAPHVAAAAAAVMAQNPLFTNADVMNVIVSQVDKVSPVQGHSLGRGVGRVNLYRTLKATGHGQPVVTSLSLQPSEIENQTTSLATVQLGGPAPVGGKLFTLASSDPSVATVPATVTVPAGGTFANFTVTAQYVGATSSTIIMATAAAETAEATLTVSGPRVNSLSLSPATVTGGSNVTGTVVLDSDAPVGGAVITLGTDSPSIVNVPAAVTIPAGDRSATFTIGTNGVPRRTSLQITASGGGATIANTLLVNPIQVSSVTVTPAQVVGGTAVTGKVTINGPAPAAGIKVILASSATAQATVPANVTVLSGQTTANFTVTTYKTALSKSVTITATFGTPATATLKVDPLLKSLTLAPTAVAGGVIAKGTLTLNTAAPAGGAVVTLTSDKSAATPPVSVTVAAGATTAVFNITTTPVAVSNIASIKATNGGTNVITKLTVKPPELLKATLAPTSVTGGTGANLTIVLTGPAPAGGWAVALSSSNVCAGVPAAATVPAGSTSVVVPVSTRPVAVSTIASLTITKAPKTLIAKLTVKPPVLLRVSLNSASVLGGGSVPGSVTLDGPAPTGGTVVTLKSSTTSATVPASITVAAGALSASFAVTTKVVAANTSAIITGVGGGVTKTATLTVLK